MKKITFLAILLIAAAQFSFIKTPVPIRQLTSSKLATGTFTYTVTEKINLALDLYNPCADEIVYLQGPLLSIYHITINGNRVTVKSSAQPQGVSGIGSVSGDKYQATGQTQETYSGSFVNGQFSYSYINNFRIIGQKTGNNFLVHETYHVTVNADGTLTSYVDNFTIDCK